jgi:hypothetical protein
MGDLNLSLLLQGASELFPPVVVMGGVYWIVPILTLAYKNKQLSNIARFLGE